MKENNMALEDIVVHAPYIVNLCNEKNFDYRSWIFTRFCYM